MTELSELARHVWDEVAANRRASVDELGTAALAWLALPPSWTDALLDAIPQSAIPRDRDNFLDRCEQLGWCTRQPVGLAGYREDVIEILIGLIGTLRQIQGLDSEILDRAVEVAATSIGEAQVSSSQRSAWSRLIGLSADEAAQLSQADTATLSEPAGTDSTDLTDELKASAHRADQTLLLMARPADLQRVVLQHGKDLPGAVLESAVGRIAAGRPPRSAARVLATVAEYLPPGSISALVSQILERTDLGAPAMEPAVANLAVASAYGTETDYHRALELSDRLTDDRLRAQALAALAGTMARQNHPLVRDVAGRIARVVVSGESVDLASAADAVARLTDADAFNCATEIIDSIKTRLNVDHLSAPDVGALVRLAIAFRQEGRDASLFVTTAIEVTNKLTDPATRSAALARILPVADNASRVEMTAEALQAAHDVVDATDRARALTRLAGLVPPGMLRSIVDHIISALQLKNPGNTFWVPDSARADLLDELERQKGLPWLRERAREIGAAVDVDDVSRSQIVPTTLRQWALLAATLEAEDDTGERASEVLLDRVQSLLRSGFIPEALGWIETGRRLLRLVCGTFDTSLLVASRRIELAQRTADDRRLLQRFLRRKEQLDAFRDLLEVADGNDPWALHYLGAGGFGKTMLLRHLSGVLAPAERFAVARIDFDRLSPDFPLKRPGQLLLDLLEELEVYATPDTREMYENAHKVLRYQKPSPQSGLAGAHSTLERAIGFFCAYLEALGPRIVLMLDTCEEIAKFEPVGAALPELEAAFWLLERIHEEVPAVRVVFVGRRPLARRVHGGRALARRRAVDYLPAEKPYLAVHEVTGFTDTEAKQYLSEMEGLTLEPDTVRELLDRSQSAPQRPVYSGHPDAAPTIRRIPFDLAQYAAALREDPGYLSSRQRDLAYAIYVRDRIAHRLGPASAKLLPAVVAMSRFDMEMLRIALLLMPDGWVTPEQAWQELGAVEWIAAHVDQFLETTFLEVDRTMLERLRAYYVTPDRRTEYDRARRGLADGLASLVRDRALTDLAVAHVDAALRCLPAEDGAKLCDELTLRVAADTDIQAWMWAYHVFSQVLGLDGALADPSHLAHASANALYTTALFKVKPTGDLRPQWKAITEKALNHPYPATRSWLVSRANLLASPRDTPRWIHAMRQVRRLLKGEAHDQRRAVWLVGTILAVASSVMDSVDSDRALTGEGQQVLREIAGGEFGPQVSVVAKVLLARALMVAGGTAEAETLFTRALTDATVLQFSRPEPGAGSELAAPGAKSVMRDHEVAADGGVPDNLRDWVRLQAVLTRPAGVTPYPMAVDEWLSQALDAIQDSTDADQVADPDSDRLAALLLSLLLNEKPLPADRLAPIEHAIGTRAPPPARTLAHHQVPALRVVLSRAWLALADPDRARAVLGPPASFAETAAGQRELDLARVDIARRMRLPKSDRGVRLKLRETCSLAEAPRVFEAMSLLGEAPPPSPELFRPPIYLHAWWHAAADPVPTTLPEPGQPGLSVEYLVDAFQVAQQWCSPTQPVLRNALCLDEKELRLIQGSRGVARYELSAPRIPTPGRLRSLKDDEQLWRQALRQAALEGEERIDFPLTDLSGSGALPGELPRTTLAGLPRLGCRRKAELALDEGELLALRLPGVGALLLRAARRWFQDSDDWVGALISHTAELLANARSTTKRLDLSELKATYQRAHSAFPGLPTWSDLRSEDAYINATTAMEPQARSTWEGWLTRLYWLQPGAYQSWHGRLSTYSKAIPPEIRIKKQRGPVTRIAAGVPQGRRVTPQTVKQLADPRRRHRRRRALAILTMLATVIVAAVYGLVQLYSALPGLPPVNAAIPRIILYFVALLLLASVLTVVIGPRNRKAIVEIEPGPSSASVAIGITALTGRPWPLPPKAKQEREFLAMLNSMTPKPGETGIHQLLRDTARPPRPLRVSLRVTGTLVAVAWEAWLGVPLPDTKMYLGRPCGVLDTETRPDSTSQDSTCWIMAPPRWRSMVRTAVQSARVDFPAQFPATAPGDVVIIVAIAVDTASGRRLVVHSGESRENDLIVDPDEATLSGLTIVVIGEPRAERRRKFTGRSTAALRGCAADLVNAGARTVIVVPNAPSATSSRVLRCITAALRPGERHNADVLSEAVDEARRVLTQKMDPQLGYELTVMSRAFD